MIFESTSIVALVLRLSASAELLRRNLTNRGADVVFSVNKLLSHATVLIFSRSPSVTGLSALATRCMFSRAFNLLQVFLPALGSRYVFSHACHPLHVFPRHPLHVFLHLLFLHFQRLPCISCLPRIQFGLLCRPPAAVAIASLTDMY